MSLRFDQYRDRDDAQRKPPPNYFSRRVQYRLMLLVTLLMLVVLVMDRARDPEIYRRFFQAIGAPLAEPAEVGIEAAAPDPIDPADPNDSPRQAARDDVPVFVSSAGADRPASEETPLARARREGWRRVLNSLEEPDRDALRATLDAVLLNPPIGEHQHAKWPPLVLLVDAAWNNYLRDARAAVEAPQATLSPDAKQAWFHILDELDAYWNEEAKPALEAVGRETAPSPAERAALVAIRHESLELAIAQIRDNMILRPAEADAWFSLLNILKHAEESSLRKLSDGSVGYLELHKQPEAYRGRLVTVRGEARMAYYVSAPQNIYDLAGYYVFTIKPADGTPSPIIIYSLDVPPGFPPIKDRDLDKETTELSEDVEFTGYLFKRWVYRSRGGVDTAPLLLAKSPRWRPAPPVTATTDQLPSVPFIAGMVLLTFFLGISVAVWVYRQSQRDPRAAGVRGSRGQSDAEADLASLSDAEIADANRSLQELAEREKSKPNDA